MTDMFLMEAKNEDEPPGVEEVDEDKPPSGNDNRPCDTDRQLCGIS